MPLRGLLRSPLTRPRKARREISASRSSCAKNSGESRSCPDRTDVATALFLVQGLEILLHLRLEVARYLFAGDGLFHHLPVLAEHAHVLQPRGHVGAASDHVGVEPVLLALPRLALHAHIVRICAESLTWIPLRGLALPLAGHESLPLGEVALLAGSPLARAVPTAAALSTATVALAAALQALAVPSPVLELAHLRERALHRVHGLVRLPALECLHSLRDVPAPG